MFLCVLMLEMTMLAVLAVLSETVLVVFIYVRSVIFILIQRTVVGGEIRHSCCAGLCECVLALHMKDLLPSILKPIPHGCVISSCIDSYSWGCFLQPAL